MNQNRDKVLAAILTLVLFLSLAGCAATDISTADPDSTRTASNMDQPTVGPSGTVDQTGIPSGSSQLVAVDQFTDRDKEIGYDATESKTLELSDSSGSVTISEPGTFVLTGRLSNGQVIIDAAEDAKIQLVFDNVSISCDSSAALYVRQAGKVFITLAQNSQNDLSTTGEFVAIDDNMIDGAIFTKSDLTLNGLGTMSVSSAFGHGIVSKDDLIITSGSYTISAARQALSGKNSIRIADGTFTLHAGSDGLHAVNDDDTAKGYIYLAGGTYDITAGTDGLQASSVIQIDGGKMTLSAGDDGLHADVQMVINDGSLLIEQSYEGIEAQSIYIHGGIIDLISSDDGLNVSSDSGIGDSEVAAEPGSPRNPGDFSADQNCTIVITGGHLSVNAGGDGIDSNGSLFVSGGETVVSGSTRNDNGAVDYMGSGQITGGTFIAASAAGMIQNFDTTSTQGSILLTAANTLQAGSEIILLDSQNQVILTYEPDKPYDAVVISAPAIVVGENYTLTMGSQTSTITMTSLIYGTGGMMGGPKGGGRKPGR